MRPKAKLSPSDVFKSISDRTGLSPKTVRVVIETYTDIIKEALLGQVEVPLGTLCTFSWAQYQPKKDYVSWDYQTKSMSEPHEVPGYQKTIVRLSKKWLKYQKDYTAFYDGEENPVSFEKMYGLPEEMDLEEENDELQTDDDDE